MNNCKNFIYFTKKEIIKPQGVDTEVDRERLRWNTVAEGAKFSHLCSSSPNTEEMDALFFIIKNAIDNNLTLFIYIQGECVLYISFSLHVILTLIVVQVKPVLEKQILPRSCVHMYEYSISVTSIVCRRF